MKYIAVKTFDDGTKDVGARSGHSSNYSYGEEYRGKNGDALAKDGLVISEQDFKALSRAEKVLEKVEAKEGAKEGVAPAAPAAAQDAIETELGAD